MKPTTEGRIVDPAALPSYVPGRESFAPLSIDANGRLLVGGALAGGDTPGDAKPNPTDNVAVTAFLEGWNSTDNQWKRLRTVKVGAEAFSVGTETLVTQAVTNVLSLDVFDYRSPGAQIPSDAVASPGVGIPNLNANAFGLGFDGTNWRRQRMNTEGAARAVINPPVSDATGIPQLYKATADATAGVMRAGVAKLLSIYAVSPDVNCYFCIVNKATAPINGDSVAFAFRCNADDSKSILAGQDIWGPWGARLGTGIAWCWSTNPNTVALVAAAPTLMVVQGEYT